VTRGAWLALVAVAALGCGVRVAVETDPGARHAGWKDWAWLARPPVARGDTDYAAIDDRVRKAFEREMKTRGFHRVDRERPDFVVTYYAAVAKPIDPKQLDYAAGNPASERSGLNGDGVYEQGTLIVDLLDAKTGRLAWRGAGRRVFQPEQTPAERSERIDEAVAAVVGEFAQR
jgi:Domain of unknown function (DUF4136)